MPKAAVDYAQHSYKSISPGAKCSCCGSSNTFYSCREQSQVCFDCNEVFETVFGSEQSAAGYNQREIVPMPYGKILPDLRGCDYTNEPEPQYLDKILCPNCGSSNVAGINPLFNSFVDDVVEGKPSWGRWYCVSCYDSWRYEYEH